MADPSGNAELDALLSQLVPDARAGAARPQPCPYERLSYLLVEDSETMRVWLRNTIVNAGGMKIDVSDSYNDALYRIRNRGNYDVVLCDYILSDTCDGQQLLEEVRRQKLLPQSTIWIMITGERKYEQVFSAVELAPDDYLIKPISPDLLHERLGRAWDQRQSLKSATDLYDAGRYDEALAVCRKEERSNPRHATGFQRIAGECMLQLGHYQEAFAHYEAVLEQRPRLPWARLGKARAFFHLDRYDETAALIEDLILDNPDYLHAHDLLAKVHERKGDLEATKALLKLVLQKNPKSLLRQREIARVAMATDDVQTAIDAYAMMHLHGRGSSFLRPGDFCAYAGMLVRSGSKAAKDRLDGLTANLADYHKDDPSFEFAARTVVHASAVTRGDQAAAAKAYADMQKALDAARSSGAEVDREQSLAMLEAAVRMRDERTACEVAAALYEDHVGNQSVEDQVQAMMSGAGWAAQAGKIADDATENLRRLNAAAAGMATHGRLLDAVEEFARLAEANRNVAVYLNAATCIVKCFEDRAAGRLEINDATRRRLVNRLQGYMNFVGQRDAGNQRLEQIRRAWDALPR
jgi:DNA-binding response OmpR family regulator